MNYLDIREIVMVHCNDLRALQHAVNHEYFEAAFRRSPHYVYNLILTAAINPKVKEREIALERLKKITRNEMKDGETLAELRIAASYLGIQRYSRMDKEELLSEVTIARETKARNGTHQSSDCGDFGSTDSATGDLTRLQAQAITDSVQREANGKSCSFRSGAD